MTYSISFRKSAAKELEHLPGKFVKKITDEIFALAHNPRPVGSKKLKASAENLWRIRSTSRIPVENK
jgi:mRNA-degrading endonuclease RelE of RelBE toxin-antitoxin system